MRTLKVRGVLALVSLSVAAGTLFVASSAAAQAATPPVAAPMAPPAAAPPAAAPPAPAAPIPQPTMAPIPIGGAPAPAPAPAAVAPAQQPAPPGPHPGHRFVLGARLGYSVPMGHLTGTGEVKDAMGNTTMSYSGTALSDIVSSSIPILFEAGYEVTPNIVLGLDFEYSINNDKPGPMGCPSGLSCSDHDIIVGLRAQYHISPGQGVDPWVGVGFGYDWERYSGSGSIPDPNNPGMTIKLSYSGGFKGPEYLRLQGGVDFLAAPTFTLGPFCSLSVVQYSSSSSDVGTFGDTPTPASSQDIPFTALHEALTFGVKGAFQVGGD